MQGCQVFFIADSCCIPSLNTDIREALEAYTVKLAKDRLRREMEAAAVDKVFLADIDEAMQAFAHSDMGATVKSEASGSGSSAFPRMRSSHT